MSASPIMRSGRRAGAPSDPWSIAALHVVTTLTGSALLALALLHGVLDSDRVWAAAHVDEDWNAEQWGMDERWRRAGPPGWSISRPPCEFWRLNPGIG